MSTMADDPIDIFRGLFQRASQSSAEADAMVLSTVDADGRPAGRFVLLKAFDQRGFVFYTNLHSPKARALAVHPYASLCFYWSAIGKQVRVEGPVEPVSDADADAYFATRPREAQIGAWASDQSATLESRAVLTGRFDELRASFEGRPVPRPPYWSGFRVVPHAIEFWTSLPGRLHERERYERDGERWVQRLLYP
jgi:pyridoxamine 5'-phosphate oxidase